MLNDPIDEAIAAVPDRVAFIDETGTTTYRELADAIGSEASDLAARGVGAGDRVPLVSAASVHATATVLACARIGAAAVPMSPLLTPSEVATVTDEVGATGPIDIAVVLLTSGTTGTPKPVPMTHALLEGRVRGFAAPPNPDGAPAVAIVCVPFHHVAGLIGVLVGLAGGNTSVLQPRFDAGRWLELVEQHRVQRAFLVPAMLSRILEHPRFASADLSSLQLVTYGAAGAPAELVARAVDAMPHVAFINVFGQTETLGAVTALGPDDHRAGRAGSVGKPMPGVEIRVVDPATGADVGDGEIGEFWVRAPHTITDGWVRSGDLVRRDADGYLYAVGRLSDVINRGGEKIDPAEVEAVVKAHPAVTDAAVFGVPDDELGQRVAAALVSDAGLTEQDVRAWCASRLARFKVPETIVFLEEIPLTELGKVSRRSLTTLVAGQ